MPTKKNASGKEQPYIPAGSGDHSGEYGDNATGSNKNILIESSFNPLKNEGKRKVKKDKTSIVKNDEICGVKKGKPMNHIEADSGNVNPKYNSLFQSYRYNCQSCSAVYEARRRGYKIQTLPFRYTKTFDDLRKHPENAFLDPILKVPKKPLNYYFLKSYDELHEKISNYVIEGRRYQFWYGNLKGANGHCVTIHRENGKLIIYDAQANKTYENALNFFESHVSLKEAPRILRVDNLDLNIDVLNKISKKGK